jgi:hypothetical protein
MARQRWTLTAIACNALMAALVLSLVPRTAFPSVYTYACYYHTGASNPLSFDRNWHWTLEDLVVGGGSELDDYSESSSTILADGSDEMHLFGVAIDPPSNRRFNDAIDFDSILFDESELIPAAFTASDSGALIGRASNSIMNSVLSPVDYLCAPVSDAFSSIDGLDPLRTVSSSLPPYGNWRR